MTGACSPRGPRIVAADARAARASTTEELGHHGRGGPRSRQPRPAARPHDRVPDLSGVGVRDRGTLPISPIVSVAPRTRRSAPRTGRERRTARRTGEQVHAPQGRTRTDSRRRRPSREESVALEQRPSPSFDVDRPQRETSGIDLRPPVRSSACAGRRMAALPSSRADPEFWSIRSVVVLPISTEITEGAASRHRTQRVPSASFIDSARSVRAGEGSERPRRRLGRFPDRAAKSRDGRPNS